MISVYYARKIGEKYVLGLYADTEEDLANFDISKPIGMYGVPGTGTTITVTGNTNTANYYISKDGSIIEIETGAPIPPEVLVPFAVGQTIVGVIIDPNGMTKSQMDDYIANIDYGVESGVVLVNCATGYGSIVSTKEQEGLVPRSVNILIYSREIDGGRIETKSVVYSPSAFIYPNSEINVPAGWSCIELTMAQYGTDVVGTATPITSISTYSFDGPTTVLQCYQQFTPLNGVIFGVVEAEPSELTPFTVGQTISGAIVDPTATPEGYANMDDYIDALIPTEERFIKFLETKNSAFVINMFFPTSNTPRNMTALLQGDPQNGVMVGYFRDSAQEGGLFFEHGWNEVITTTEPGGQTTYSISPLTQKKTYNNDVYDEVTIVGQEFTPLNGVVFGAIEAEPPVVSLIPFVVGNTVAGLDFGNYSNGDINPAIDEFLEGLTYPEEGVLEIVKLEGDAGADFYGLQALDFGILSQGMVNGYGLLCAIPNIGDIYVYSTISVEADSPVYRGFQNLLNGKVGILTRSVVGLSDVLTPEWNGVIVGEVRGNVPIYSVTANITNGIAHSIEGMVPNGKVVLKIRPEEGYTQPTELNVDGAEYYLDNSYGFILFNATGNVTVTATCPLQA